MYPCFECPPAIHWFRTVVNRRLMFCKHRFVARTNLMRYSQKWNVCRHFFVLDRWCTAATCKHKDSHSLAAHEFCKMWRYFNKVSAPRERKVLNTNKSNKSMHFYHRGSKTGFGLSTWMKVWSKLKVWSKSKCANQMFNSEHLACKVGLSFKSV